jgi:hypothetical protein
MLDLLRKITDSKPPSFYGKNKIVFPIAFSIDPMASILLRVGEPRTRSNLFDLGFPSRFRRKENGGEPMRTIPSVFISCLLLAGGTVSAYPFGDPLASVGAGAYLQGNTLADNPGRTESPPVPGCPGLAYTEIFRSKGLGYVHSREFAEAVRAVAVGASEYSPKEIPASWRDDAENWIGTESGTLPIRNGEDACNPALLYLASMEYRAKPGHEDVKPVIPRYVRAATREARVVEEWRKAGPFSERAAVVEFKIEVAERMGAGECARVELESAKLLLDRARNVAAASRDNSKGAEWLDRAERNAESLLADRQFAFRQGVRCTAMPE